METPIYVTEQRPPYPGDIAITAAGSTVVLTAVSPIPRWSDLDGRRYVLANTDDHRVVAIPTNY